MSMRVRFCLCRVFSNQLCRGMDKDGFFCDEGKGSSVKFMKIDGSVSGLIIGPNTGGNLIDVTLRTVSLMILAT